jgi:hypothetical protein
MIHQRSFGYSESFVRFTFLKVVIFWGYIYHILAMFGWYRLVLVVVVVFSTSKLTHKKLTPWMFGWRC